MNELDRGSNKHRRGVSLARCNKWCLLFGISPNHTFENTVIPPGLQVVDSHRGFLSFDADTKIFVLSAFSFQSIAHIRIKTEQFTMSLCLSVQNEEALVHR